jgi:hypothetical protein
MRSELGTIKAHFGKRKFVAQGWKFKMTRPNPDGGPNLQGLVVVHVADQQGAIIVAGSKMQDAIFQIDSEASAELLGQYDIKPGEMLVLVEGQ